MHCIPDYAAHGKFVFDYLNNSATTYTRINDLFGEDDFQDDLHYDIIKGISENNELFRRYHRAPFKKYYTINSAINHLNGNILIHFTNLHLYAVIEDIPEFKEFIDNVSGSVETFVDLRQVLLVSDKQKIIFVCNDTANDKDNTVTKIQNYCKQVFDATMTTDIIDDMIQITIEDIIDNYKESMYKFKMFKDQMADKELAKSLSIIPSIKKQDHVYIQPSITNVLTNESIDQLIAVLKNVAPGTTINQLIIGNYNNITGYINNDNIQPVDKTQIAREWINANPPNNREFINSYHLRYVAAHPDGITRRKLSPLVRELDYTTHRTTKGICWIKE